MDNVNNNEINCPFYVMDAGCCAKILPQKIKSHLANNYEFHLILFKNFFKSF